MFVRHDSRMIDGHKMTEPKGEATMVGSNFHAASMWSCISKMISGLSLTEDPYIADFR